MVLEFAPPPVECVPPSRCGLIDELDLITLPATGSPYGDVLDVEVDTRWTFSVTVSLTASVSVSWSW